MGQYEVRWWYPDDFGACGGSWAVHWFDASEICDENGLISNEKVISELEKHYGRGCVGKIEYLKKSNT